MNITIRTIDNLRELDSICASWQDWQNHPNSDFTHFKLVCELRKEASPYIIFAKCDDKPQALLVARMERTHFTAKIGYLKLAKIPAKVVVVIYRGLLGEVNESLAKALIIYLQSIVSSGSADAVVFHHLPEHSVLWPVLTADGGRWFRERKPSWSGHWQMDLPAREGFLLEKMRSKHRSWIRGRQRQLESAFPGKVNWRWLTRFENMPRVCSELEAVASLTYQRGLGAGFVNNEEHRKRLSMFADRNMLRIEVLEIDGEMRAFWIGTIYGKVFFSSATGYDPELRSFEIGTLIFLRMVDELIREGVKNVDFGLGDAHYKQRFGDKSWQEGTIHLFAPTIKGLILRSVLSTAAVLDRAGRSALHRVKIFDKVKTAWRRRLLPKGSSNVTTCKTSRKGSPGSMNCPENSPSDTESES